MRALFYRYLEPSPSVERYALFSSTVGSSSLLQRKLQQGIHSARLTICVARKKFLRKLNKARL